MKFQGSSFWRRVLLLASVVACWLVSAEPGADQLLGRYSIRAFIFNATVSYLALGGLWILSSASRRRKRTFAFTVLSLACIVALALIELTTALSLVDYRTVFNTPIRKAWENPRNVLDPELLHIHRPHDSFSGSIPGDLVDWLGIETTRRYDVNVRYDHNGFRNQVDMESADVVMIGDSFVEGSIVPFESITSSRLSTLLGAKVLNLGQTGYSPQQEWATLRRYGFGARPRVVIWILFEGNDLTHDYRRYERFAGRLNEFVARHHGIWARSFSRNLLLRLSRIASRPEDTRRDKGLGRSGILQVPGEMNEQRIYFGFGSLPLTKEDDTSIAGVQRIIVEAAEACRQKGLDFLLVYAPIKYRVVHHVCAFAPGSQTASWSVHTAEDRIERWARSEGISFLDLTPALRQATDRGKIPYFLDDGHWNATGHGVAATEIAAHMRQLGWDIRSKPALGSDTPGNEP